ncbi:Mu-like prophage major head subunit gpT family protein [Gluconobacter oxydans]|uniref:Mu-like prophage major head subunit gpT family protein n=1 Tax=Gluconobacter oxydans TaxID=442 RepID=UPI003464E279
MDINAGNINALTATLNLAFNKQLGTGPSQYQRFSMTVPSDAGENFYPRMAELPGVRKWVGPREIHQLEAGSYVIRNETYEETISVKREDLEDDKYGFLSTFVSQLGQDASEMPDRLCFDVLQSGDKIQGIDKQYFFDTDHVAVGADRKSFTYANLAGPASGETAGPAWYLLCTTRIIKPIIYQPRRAFAITAKTRLTDDNVFHDKEFIWGTDGRCAAGVGMWQLAFKSTRPLNEQTYEDARSAMSKLCRADGTPYGIVPDLLVVPSNLEKAGRYLLKSEYAPTVINGASGTAANPWVGSADLMVAPRLSQTAGG